MLNDYGLNDFREIGKLSSMLPAYFRHCCRSLHDGTDDNVLLAYRDVALRELKPFKKKYDFAVEHSGLMLEYTPDDVKKIILGNSVSLTSCHAINTTNGLPKRSCLHCPKVGLWLRIMKEGVKECD